MAKKAQSTPLIDVLDRQIIGWQEEIALPDFGIESMNAKVDTGARTTALHAIDLETFDRDGTDWISFHIPRHGIPRTQRDEAMVHDHRAIKNTSGVSETRYVIETRLVLGKRRWTVEVSLADREEMAFDIILGRTAIRRRKILVAPGKSFLLGSPIPSKRK